MSSSLFSYCYCDTDTASTLLIKKAVHYWFKFFYSSGLDNGLITSLCLWRGQFWHQQWITPCPFSPHLCSDPWRSRSVTCHLAVLARWALSINVNMTTNANKHLFNFFLCQQYMTNTAMQGTYIPQYTPVPPSSVTVEVWQQNSPSVPITHVSLFVFDC